MTRMHTSLTMLRWAAAALLAVPALAAGAQTAAQLPKTGLWEMTTTRRYQSGPTRLLLETVHTFTSNLCVTRAQLDRYQAILPPREPGCEISAITHSGNTTKISSVCRSNGMGSLTVDSTTQNPEHATVMTRFLSTVPTGTSELPLQYTIENKLIFQRSTCGIVRPLTDYPY